MYTLLKHPDETVQYTLDFASPLGYDGPRGTVWPQGAILHAGETFTAAAPTLTLRRADGQADDLVVSASQTTPTTIQLTLAGGTDGVTYQIGAAGITTTGETRVGQGLLAVSTVLP